MDEDIKQDETVDIQELAKFSVTWVEGITDEEFQKAQPFVKEISEIIYDLSARIPLCIRKITIERE